MKNKKEKEIMEMKKKMIELIGSMEKSGLVATNEGFAVIGNTPDVMYLLSMTVRKLVEGGVNKELVEKAVELAFLNEEELKEKALESVNDFLKTLKDNLD